MKWRFHHHKIPKNVCLSFFITPPLFFLTSPRQSVSSLASHSPSASALSHPLRCESVRCCFVYVCGSSDAVCLASSLDFTSLTTPRLSVCCHRSIDSHLRCNSIYLHAKLLAQCGVLILVLQVFSRFGCLCCSAEITKEQSRVLRFSLCFACGFLSLSLCC